MNKVKTTLEERKNVHKNTLTHLWIRAFKFNQYNLRAGGMCTARRTLRQIWGKSMERYDMAIAVDAQKRGNCAKR